jgi:hypothetical protein
MEEFQKDLFPEFEGEKKTRRFRKPYSFSHKTYIKLEQPYFIFLIICFLLVTLFSYILGYKKAKTKFIIKRTIQNVTKPIKKEKPIVKENIKEKKEERFIYQVQLVTYKSERYASEEIDKLKKEGFNPFIEKKGKYRIICVGDFKSNDEAKEILRKLKKKYKDAFIKKIKKSDEYPIR